MTLPPSSNGRRPSSNGRPSAPDGRSSASDGRLSPASADSRSASPTRVDAYCSTGSSPGRVGRTRVTIPTDFCGPAEVEVSWEERGPAHGPLVVVLGGLSAGRHLLPTALDPSPGWWPGVVGPGRALDPGRLRLVGMDFLAVDRGPVTTGDQARALAVVLDTVGGARATIVGASYGGMVALAFAGLFPERTRRLVVVCAAHRTHPMATAWRSIQRSLVRLGDASDRSCDALALARELAMTTYRSAEEFELRFHRDPVVDGGSARFPVEPYLEARGRDFASRFRPDRFLRLSESIDLHDVDPGTVRCPTTAVSFDTDTLVPPWLVDELAAATAGPCRHVRIDSVYGHDAFLKEDDRLAEVLRVVGPDTGVDR
jgi:homoserine O-acetyltransferase